MARPVNASVSFGFGLYPTSEAAIRIYKRLGLRGHNGDDYAVYLQPTYAVQPGTVVTAGWVNDGGGFSVRIRFKWKDGRFYIAQHDHLSRVDVRVGDQVKAGQRVGITGGSGATAGYHLHYAIRPESGYNPNDGYYGYINPQPFYESLGGSMTEEQVFGACFITQAHRWPNQKETDVWKRSGLAPYDWVQKHAPNPTRDQERINAFSACFITLATRWPTKEETKQWQKSGISAYEWCQKNAPNVAVDMKENEIRNLHIALEKCEQSSGPDAQLGRKVRELVKEVV